MNASAGPRPLRSLLFLLVFSAIAFFAFLGARQVQNPDEPREAETARECRAGDWTVVPEFNGKPFLEHPPLFYWMAAGAMDLCGGPSDFAAKAPAALFGVVAVLATWLAAETLLGAGGGWLAALLLLGMPYVVLKFRTGIGDTGLAAFTTLSLALFFRSHARKSWALAAAAGLAAGLAFMCKGLLGFGIPAVVAGTYLGFRREWKALLHPRQWLAILVGCAVAAPWVLALHHEQGGEGLHRFFIWNHFQRATSADADHAHPFWFYVCILWTALPLTPLAVAAALHRPAADEPERDGRLAGLCWILPVLAVLCIASGKRVVYLLPLLPGFAILGAAMLRAADRGALGPRAAAVVRGTTASLRYLSVRRGPKGPAALATGACATLLVLAVAWDSFAVASRNEARSGYALAARLKEIAGDRPLVPFRVGEGEMGQFAFALRRKLPWVWEEKALRQAAGPGSAIVFGEPRYIEEAKKEYEDSLGVPEGGKRKTGLSPDATRALQPLGSGIANGHEFQIYEWKP
jgi:4-amino-4-deoxy-L-arabinose transferase-like glycosyltransferase